MGKDPKTRVFSLGLKFLFFTWNIVFELVTTDFKNDVLILTSLRTYSETFDLRILQDIHQDYMSVQTGLV